MTQPSPFFGVLHSFVSCLDVLNGRRRRRSAVVIAGCWLSLALAAPVAAQVDERCEVLMPGTELTRSVVVETVDCELRCIFEQTIDFCVLDPETGEQNCTPGEPFEVSKSFPVDDCSAQPIIRRLGGIPRDSLDADLEAALDRLEAQAVADTIALHELPATDLGRVRRLADNGRSELTANLYARVFEIAFLDPAERTAEQQLIAEAFANEWHNLHRKSLELAKAEFDEWSQAPCSYVPPDPFTYDPDPSGTLCTGNFTLVQLFTMVTPPSLAEFIAYGQFLSGSAPLQDVAAALAAAELARSLDMVASTSVVAGEISILVVAALVVTANVVLPFAGAGTALAATLGALGGGFFFGPFIIIYLAAVAAVIQAINVFSAAEIGPSLDDMLAASQTRPALSQVLTEPEGAQEFFNAFLVTTLPGVDTSGTTAPDSDDECFLVTDKDDGNPVELETLDFIGWEQDPDGWGVRLANGWFITEKDLSANPDAGVDQVARQTLVIEYLGWTKEPLDVREMFAWRTGSRFFILPKGGDPETDGRFSDELLFFDPAACDPECDFSNNDPRRIATILSDDTPPVITANPAGTLGAKGWYTSDVTIAWDVSDPDSEILDTDPAGCPDVPVTVDGITDASCAATSRGGTREEAVSVKRDASPPSISGETDPLPNAGGWHNGASVEVIFTCSDFAPSGKDVAAADGGCGPNATVTDESASPAGTAVTGIATDVAGNMATSVVTVKLDRTPPAITGSRTPEANGAGWNNSNVAVSFDCSDALSGVLLCANNWVFNTEGDGQSLAGDAQDFAGNRNSTVVEGINIDLTPPGIVGSAAPAPNASGWNNTDVTVHFECTDALSGVAACTADAILGEGAGQSQGGSAMDRAGNVNTTEVTGIDVDKTAPVVNLLVPPDNMPEYLLHETVLAEWSASDALSGLAGSNASADNGVAIDTGSQGEKMFEVQADDVAGNRTIVQHGYIVLSPEEAIGQLEDRVQSLIDGGVLKRNQANGLLSPLANAIRSLLRDKLGAACSQLADFVAEVDAKTPSPIDSEVAAGLTFSAEQIAIISLQCHTH